MIHESWKRKRATPRSKHLFATLLPLTLVCYSTDDDRTAGGLF